MYPVTRTRWGVVQKAPNNAKYDSWSEEAQEDTDQWGKDDWGRFQREQDEELASCEAEIAAMRP